MAKLFLLADPRVNGVMVRGEMIVDESNRNTIMTRSKARAGKSAALATLFANLLLDGATES